MPRIGREDQCCSRPRRLSAEYKNAGRVRSRSPKCWRGPVCIWARPALVACVAKARPNHRRADGSLLKGELGPRGIRRLRARLDKGQLLNFWVDDHGARIEAGKGRDVGLDES